MASPRNWFDVWQGKGEQAVRPRSEPDLGELVRLAGYDSCASSLDLEQYHLQLRYIVDAVGIGPDESVYEVGCGAGSLLYSLASRCARVGGSDFAPALIEVAQSVLASDDLAVMEACEVPLLPMYDVVLSNGVFIYFPDEDYAGKVLRNMLAKAGRVVGVFDVNDRATHDEYRRERREAGGEVAAPEQLFLDREFFTDLAADHGVRCLIQDSVMTGSINGRYRYNVLMFH